MPKKKLTNYEQQVLEAFEKGEFTVLDQAEDKKERYQSYAHATAAKNKSISLRISERDLQQRKTKSLEVGIPYQTLLNALIHQFNTGKIELSL